SVKIKILVFFCLFFFFLAQLVSQKRECRRHRPRLRNGTLRIQHGIFSIQADLPFSYASTYLAGSLRSTDVTPLPRYYEPRRLPTEAEPRVMPSPRPLH